MPSPEQVVREFCAAARTRDPQVLRASSADDVVYHNIPMEPAGGIEATMAIIDMFIGMCEELEFEVHHVAVRRRRGAHRAHRHVHHQGHDGTPPVMGAFHVVDGKIIAWRDYFDMGQVDCHVRRRVAALHPDPAVVRASMGRRPVEPRVSSRGIAPERRVVPGRALPPSPTAPTAACFRRSGSRRSRSIRGCRSSRRQDCRGHLPRRSAVGHQAAGMALWTCGEVTTGASTVACCCGALLCRLL